MDYFGYDESDFIPCEICESKAVDIHHIEARGAGGCDRDEIENLMAVCRKCHIEYGDVSELEGKLKHIHILRMDNR
jgi:hypothetical protein